MRNEACRKIAFLVLAISGLWLTEHWALSQPPEASQSSAAPVRQTQGAVSTGSAHAAVLDNEKRP
jgi:hypothetical protein